MCNLYTVRVSAAEVANYFSAKMANQFNAGPGEIYPDGQGMVIANEAGESVLRSMTWGFPLSLKSKKTGKPLKPKPVNNARSDKLDSYMWRYSFKERRCLIPLTAWAEAEGPRGSMTRTWISVPDVPMFACAGIWRDSEEWGPVYSMVMTDADGDAAKVHSRMPVLLAPDDYGRWTDGTPEEARMLCSPWLGDLTIDRTDSSWVASRKN